MMFLVTADEMRECDRRTIEECGTPGPVLMERAGWGVAGAILRRYRRLNRRRIWIVCGRGNNGGDGLVLARLLHDAGYNPRVLLTDPPSTIKGDAALQIPPLRRRGVPLETIGSDFAAFASLEADDLLVDAILGTGFRGPLTGEKQALVEAMNRSPARVVAVDIPSGLSADHGTVSGEAINAELTVTMGCAKRSFFFWPARESVGALEIVDIGIPDSVLEDVAPVARLTSAEDLVTHLRRFPPHLHKGSRGKVLLAGGSPGLTGAICLAAAGAAGTGAGLVRAAVPRSLNSILEAKMTEPMTLPMAETEAGSLSRRARVPLLELAGSWDALVLGPGLGRHKETDRLVADLYRNWAGPLLIDADGLTALATARVSRSADLPIAIFTPHPGEMARLSGRRVSEIVSDPVGTARSFAREWGVVLLLKGSPTVVADPRDRLVVNPTGNVGLATGGSGDVLSGIIGALRAQEVDPFWAAACGAYLHGWSADLLAEQLDPRSIAPSAVAAGLSAVWLRFQETRIER